MVVVLQGRISLVKGGAVAGKAPGVPLERLQGVEATGDATERLGGVMGLCVQEDHCELVR